jgi:hypothetical protein
MAQHKLSLEVPDTLNKCIFRVVDTSIYADLVPTECGILQITPPGFTESYTLEYDPAFIENITLCELGIQTTNCDNYNNNFSDGVYVVRYSVAPNDLVYVEYNHLRITNALNLMNNLLCCIDIPDCAPQGKIKETLKEIHILDAMLKGAKAKVEYCQKPNHGTNMLAYVNERLKKLHQICGCSCETC